MKTILNNNQILFLQEFKVNDFFKHNFYLAGGTALSEFYLHHRLSEDLDFFTSDDFDPNIIDIFINKFESIIKPNELFRQKIYDRYIYNFVFQKDILKVEFVKYEFKNLKPLKLVNNIFINDIFDIAVNKFFAFFDRNEIKDFVDLYFLIKKYPIPTLIEGVKTKFGFSIDPIMVGGELLKINKSVLMPKMLVPLTKEQLISFFENQALQLKKNVFEE